MPVVKLKKEIKALEDPKTPILAVDELEEGHKDAFLEDLNA